MRHAQSSLRLETTRATHRLSFLCCCSLHDSATFESVGGAIQSSRLTTRHLLTRRANTRAR